MEFFWVGYSSRSGNRESSVGFWTSRMGYSPLECGVRIALLWWYTDSRLLGVSCNVGIQDHLFIAL